MHTTFRKAQNIQYRVQKLAKALEHRVHNPGEPNRQSIRVAYYDRC